MPYIPDRNIGFLLTQAMQEFGVSQEKFGEMLGSSRRTVTRWFGGGSSPSIHQLQKLARILYPRDAELAAQIAGQTGSTLEALGIAPPPKAPAPPPPVLQPPQPPAPPPRPRPSAEVLADSIVCAAAEALGTAPSGVREVVRASFRRARATGLTVEEIDDVFSPASPAEAEAPKGSARGRTGKAKS
jgi:transcriptional regulator with XRE-family HTH domain